MLKHTNADCLYQDHKVERDGEAGAAAAVLRYGGSGAAGRIECSSLLWKCSRRFGRLPCDRECLLRIFFSPFLCSVGFVCDFVSSKHIP